MNVFTAKILDPKLVVINVADEEIEKVKAKKKTDMEKKEEELVRKMSRIWKKNSPQQEPFYSPHESSENTQAARAKSSKRARRSTATSTSPSLSHIDAMSINSVADDSLNFSVSSRCDVDSERNFPDEGDDEENIDHYSEALENMEWAQFNIYEGFWTDFSLRSFFKTLSEETTYDRNSRDRWLRFTQRLFSEYTVCKSEADCIAKVNISAICSIIFLT